MRKTPPAADRAPGRAHRRRCRRLLRRSAWPTAAADERPAAARVRPHREPAIRRPNRRCQSTAGVARSPRRRGRAARAAGRRDAGELRAARPAHADRRQDVDALKGGFAERRGGGRAARSGRHAGAAQHAGARRRERHHRQAVHQQGGRPHDLSVRSDRTPLLLLRAPRALRRRPEGRPDRLAGRRHRLRRHDRQRAAEHAAPAFRRLRADADRRWWQGRRSIPILVFQRRRAS